MFTGHDQAFAAIADLYHVQPTSATRAKFQHSFVQHFGLAFWGAFEAWMAERKR